MPKKTPQKSEYEEIELKKGQIVKITKDMIIGDVISVFPEAVEVIIEFGIHCIGCHGAMYETLEMGCGIHGINADDLCKEINKRIKESRKPRTKTAKKPPSKTSIKSQTKSKAKPKTKK